jgi:hypothetical protein
VALPTLRQDPKEPIMTITLTIDPDYTGERLDEEAQLP